MSITFTKLFSSITESTVWGESDETRIVWITMLAMCDYRGRVWSSLPGLAHRARVSLEDTRTALTVFESPDQYSRNPDNEGRRIEKIDGGWRLLNYDKYREIKDDKAPINPTTKETVGKIYFIQCGGSVKIGFSVNPWARLASLKTGMPEEPRLLGYIHGTPSDEKRLQGRFNKDKLNREWFSLSAEILAFVKTECATGSDSVVISSELPQLQQDADADAEADAEARSKSKEPPISPKGDDGFDLFWSTYNYKVSKVPAEKAWKKLKPNKELQATILAAITAQQKTEKWTKDNGKFRKHPSRWLNEKCWEDEVSAPSEEIKFYPFPDDEVTP